MLDTDEDELDLLLLTREEVELVRTLERETFDDLAEDMELERELMLPFLAARMHMRKL